MHSIFFSIYRLLIAPSVLLLVLFLYPFSRKIQAGIRMRKQSVPTIHPDCRLVWIHASSGEFEYAKPIIAQLKQQDTNWKILITYFSPSYRLQIEKFAGVDYAYPLPLDLKGPIQSFLRKVNPKLFLVARTDLWPELLYNVHRKEIPSLLFSATFAPISGYKRYRRFYYRFVYSLFSQIFTVTDEDRLNLEAAIPSLTKVKVVGDTRYDQVFARLENPKVVKNVFSPTDRYFVAGSTWPEDEDVLFPAILPFLVEKKIKLVLVPHEFDKVHLNKIYNLTQHAQIRTALYSQAQDDDWDLLIVDQTGILAELYTFAVLAFVGGSFRKKVHSVMEPLAAGIPTLVGPFHTNNREATQFREIRFSSGDTAVQVVQDSYSMAQSIQNWLAKEEFLAEIKDAIRMEARRRCGASNEVLDWIVTQGEKNEVTPTNS